MKKSPARLVNFLRDDCGAVASEYAILVAAIVLAVALATVMLGDGLSVLIRDAADCAEVGCF